MRLTRSIRRKLVIGLAILVVMLAGLTAASVTGLAGYKRVVRDLEVAIAEAPRQSDLLAATGHLIEPLSAQLPPEDVAPAARQRVAAEQKRHFEDAIVAVRADFERYHHGLDSLPADPRYDRVCENIHRGLLTKLDKIAASADRLDDLDRRSDMVAWIGKQIAELSDLARQAPDPLARLTPMLRDARNDRRRHGALVWVTAVAAGVMLTVLVWLGVRWVFRPVRCLATGAELVAAGHYDVRIDWAGPDEMGKLAASFNQMTERFQQVLADRDREIEERSRQLVQSARLADVGFLAAGIAHEVNNPLSAVGMAAESLEWRMSEVLEGVDEADADGIRQYLTMIQKETQRVRELTQRMLDFARRGPEADGEKRNVYDVTAIVTEVLSMVDHLKRYSGRTTSFDPGRTLYAHVDAGELKQVVLNLVTNAMEAMQDGGTLKIAARQTCDELELTFADDGCGMTPEVAERLFDPFFTTKGGGSSGTAGTGGSSSASGHTGTGLGLAITHRIVEDHGGTLTAASAGEGQGSTFTLRLPAAKAVQQAA